MTTLPPSPISPLTMAILLALAKEDQHGYALMQEVEAQTGGVLTPGTGSLYAALQRLLDEGLIVDVPVRRSEGDDSRRKYFRITTAGRAAARAEAQRMARVLDVAREKKVIGTAPSLRGAR